MTLKEFRQELEAAAAARVEANITAGKSGGCRTKGGTDCPRRETTLSLQGIAAWFRHALQSAMPKLLTNGQQSPRDEMRELIEQVTPKKLRDQLLAAWAKV